MKDALDKHRLVAMTHPCNASGTFARPSKEGTVAKTEAVMLASELLFLNPALKKTDK